MDPKALQKLVTQAQHDPQFFHALVFDTERVLKQLDYLERDTQAAIAAISPEEVIAILGGGRAGCAGTCAHTCEVSCIRTCCQPGLAWADRA